ncbi:hypothetical protein GOP47_0026505 [Adiantum capillus-veneris]|nr:hypothetical protein GOP47_0026505 [Adiantum capillus-veneris]
MHGAARAMDFSSTSEAGASASGAGDDPFFMRAHIGQAVVAGENIYMLHTHEPSKKKPGAGHQHTGTQQCNTRKVHVRRLDLSSSNASTSGAGDEEELCAQSSTREAKMGVCTRRLVRNAEEDPGLRSLIYRAGPGHAYVEQSNSSENGSNVGGLGTDENEVHAQLSLLALLLAAFRRSGLTCQSPQDEIKMDIGWPTNVQHVTHVTFDRFNGFLGLPVEFELEVPRRVPSASASVFGVSAESMQCSYDGHGNSVPTILLLMQERLYDQGGLKAEGIFRINPENSQEEHVRDQLNKGNVPLNIDVHCLAGLIKAWLRELPHGVLDSLPPDQLLQCTTEDDCLGLVKMLPPTQGALLDWVVNLMADVVQEEDANKMNARNVAMVFAPNMTQMSDPLTALMHAVQVMNFLKTLILKTLQDRQVSSTGCKPVPTLGLGLPNISWQERVISNGKLNQEDKAIDKLTHENVAAPSRNVIERKGSMDHQDKCSVNVEERFFRGFSGRDTTDDLISNGRLAMSSVHASVF